MKYIEYTLCVCKICLCALVLSGWMSLNRVRWENGWLCDYILLFMGLCAFVSSSRLCRNWIVASAAATDSWQSVALAIDQIERCGCGGRVCREQCGNCWAIVLKLKCWARHDRTMSTLDAKTKGHFQRKCKECNFYDATRLIGEML